MDGTGAGPLRHIDDLRAIQIGGNWARAGDLDRTAGGTYRRAAGVRGVMDDDRVEAEFAGRDVPRPSFWGGYRLAPDVVEFWQHRENRLHDRLAYRRRPGGWDLVRLAP